MRIIARFQPHSDYKKTLLCSTDGRGGGGVGGRGGLLKESGAREASEWCSHGADEAEGLRFGSWRKRPKQRHCGTVRFRYF